MKNTLPNFLIVGAAKCGTTSLHNYINQHPEVFMPSYNNEGVNIKEPQYLVKNMVQNRLHFGIWSWNEYKSLFLNKDNYKAIGEASVFYLYYYKEAIKNIKIKLGNNIKIIILLRNPIDRAYSAYNHVSKGLKENLSFEEALNQENKRLTKDKLLTPMVMYKEMGLYYKMVKAYTESFKNVHIILYDEFITNTDSVLKDTFEFLDVDSSISINSKAKYNTGGKRWKSVFLKNFFYQNNFLKRLLPIFIKDVLRRNLVTLLTKKIPPMNGRTNEYLNSYFKEDIENLAKLISRNLKHWIK